MSLISGLLFFVAFVPYIWAIIHGQTTPSPTSWFIWTSVDALALVAMVKEKAVVGQLVGAVAGASVVTLLAVIFGKSSMGPVEWVSIAIAIVGIGVWQMSGRAVLAIVFSQIAILAGAIPTFVSAWHNPGQENPVAWLIWLASCVCALIAVPKWNIANGLQPVTFTVVEATMVILVVVVPFLR